MLDFVWNRSSLGKWKIPNETRVARRKTSSPLHICGQNLRRVDETRWPPRRHCRKIQLLRWSVCVLVQRKISAENDRNFILCTGRNACMSWPLKIALSLSRRTLYSASLCSVTYCVSRGLLSDGSPETGNALMNDGKTLLDLKYFPIVLTRNGWNVFAIKSHRAENSRHWNFPRLVDAREKLRENFYKAVAKILALKQWKIHQNERIRPFLFHPMLSI